MSKDSSLTDDALVELVASTLGHYGSRAEAFWQGTRDHDVSQNRNALLRNLEGDGPFRILDLGCGPGRDVLAFKEAGHLPTGLDGTEEFCEMAKKLTGCPMIHQNMLDLDLPKESFDGVFANASLFHVPRQELPQVLTRLRAALTPRGVLFASNPRGENQEGYNGARYGSYHDQQSWTTLVESVGFAELEHYFRPPGKPRDQQPWLATVFRKTD